MIKVDYAIVVKNKTRLELLIDKFNTRAQAQFYIERQGASFDDYIKEHDTFHKSFESILAQLTKEIKFKVLERAYLPNYIFSDNQVIIVVGQDGLVANTAKYARGRPIIGVNPDIGRFDGILLKFNTSNFIRAVDDVLLNSYKRDIYHFAKASLNDGQTLIAFNDLFIGSASHISARYKISFGKKVEEHSSSGIIVSTRAGSTGWLKSVYNMANGIMRNSIKQNALPLPRLKNDELIFVVREPFDSIRTQCGITVGNINKKNELIIESLMPTSGVIFSDGIESDALKFNSGSIARIGITPEIAEIVL